MPKVSIILPVYNVEKYIRDCIQSIVNQTYNDFELIVVDDGTKDRSVSIVEESLKNTAVKFRIIHRDNGGLSAARNTGIRNAGGDYICFIDSDDVINPAYIETLLGDIETNNVDLAIGNFKWVSDEDKFQFDYSKSIGQIVNKSDFLKKILKRKVFNYFGCFLIKREYIVRNNLWFDETVFFGVDQAYMWRLMVGVEKYTYNKKIVYNYYNRPGSIMTATKIEKMLTGLPSLIKCANELKDNPFFDANLIVDRWIISVLHTTAKVKEYKVFRSLLERVSPNKTRWLKYPDVRVKFLFLASLFGNKCLYYVLKKN